MSFPQILEQDVEARADWDKVLKQKAGVFAADDLTRTDPLSYYTALHRTVMTGLPAAARAMLSADPPAEVDARGMLSGSTPLHMCCMYWGGSGRHVHSPEIAALLCSHRADVNAHDILRRYTPLHMIIQYGAGLICARLNG